MNSIRPFHRIIAGIGPLDQAAMQQARQRQERLTKPAGSLGRLEELSVQIAGITGQLRPSLEHKVVFLFAGDHGVTAAGVSAYPAEVTAQMVYNFVRGGAAINVLARHAGARVVIADLGVAVDLAPHPEILVRKVAYGTQNMVEGPAMTAAQAVQAVATGIDLFEAELERGVHLAATGDMGIGNTTPSSAITAVMTGRPVAEVTGRGTGIDEARWAGKVQAIERALEVNQPDPGDALDVLAKVGGFEIGGLAGVILAAAAHRVPVLLDGFISGAAALIAAGLCPAVKPFLIASHRSVEAGHRAVLQALEAKPLLDLDLRLGEGTGAALAMSLVEAAVKILNEMATFAEAGVSEKSP